MMKVVSGQGIMPVTRASVRPSRSCTWWSCLVERQSRKAPASAKSPRLQPQTGACGRPGLMTAKPAKTSRTASPTCITLRMAPLAHLPAACPAGRGGRTPAPSCRGPASAHDQRQLGPRPPWQRRWRGRRPGLVETLGHATLEPTLDRDKAFYQPIRPWNS